MSCPVPKDVLLPPPVGVGEFGADRPFEKSEDGSPEARARLPRKGKKGLREQVVRRRASDRRGAGRFLRSQGKTSEQAGRAARTVDVRRRKRREARSISSLALVPERLQVSGTLLRSSIILVHYLELFRDPDP